MKKRTKYISKIFLVVTVITFTLLCYNGYSQTINIVAAEYFFNTDPGIGHATAIPISVGDSSINNNLIIPTTGLNPGFNHLFIRVKNNLGKWSHYEDRTILIKDQFTAPTQLNRGEYFFDTDPGIDHATSFPNFQPGNNINILFTVSTAGLTEGFHSLFYRVKDMSGIWSLYEGGLFYIRSLTQTSPLNYCEYFFGTGNGTGDPGVGNGVHFTFPGTNLRKDSIDIPTIGLASGINNLFFRYRDSLDIYSLYLWQSFRICDVAAEANFSADTVCLGDTTSFVNLSTHGDSLTHYLWDFDGNGSIDQQNTGTIGHGTPLQFFHYYTSGGTFQCKLITNNGGGCSDTIIKPVMVIAYPHPPTPTGPIALCKNNPNTTYTIHSLPGATSYIWVLTPPNAGTLTNPSDTVALIDWNNTFVGTAQLKVKANYGPCSNDLSAPYSANLNIIINPPTVGGSITLAQSSICQGSTTGAITLSGNTGAILYWLKRNTPFGGNTGSWIHIPFTNNVFTETPSTSGIWEYMAVINNGGCDTVFSNYVSITVFPIPTPAGTIIGTSSVCQGQQLVSYTVPAISGATNYTWVMPTGGGANIITGQGTNSILVNYTNSATSGSITVFGSNNCGTGSISPLFPINVHIPPVAHAGTDALIWYNTTYNLNGSGIGGTGSYTYSWSPSPLLVNPNIHNPVTIPLLNSTPFTLTVTDSLGCQGTDDVNIIVHGQPISATPYSDPPIICQGASSQLIVLPSGGNTGTYQYSWAAIPPAIFTSTVQNPIVSPTATTQYVVTVNDGAQTVSNTVTVTISPKPSAAGIISGSGTVCEGQTDVVFSVPSIANASGYNWTFSPPGNNITIASGSNTNTIVANFGANAQSGTISVNGTNNCGSGLPSTNFSITANQVPVANAGVTQSIPIGNPTTLHGGGSGGSGNYSYSWSPANFLVNANVQNPQTDTLNSSMSFTLTVTDNVTSCSSSSSVLVLVQGFPLNATTNAVPATICQGSSSQISALPSGGSGTYSFVWSSNPGNFSSNLQTINVSPTITTEYTVTVTSGAQSITSNVIVTVMPLPTQVGLITGDNVVCKGDTIAYSVASIASALNYYWQLPPGASIYSGNGTNTIVVNYSNSASSGNINVYASNFCGSGPVSNNLLVTVNLLPIANAGNDVILPQVSPTTLHGSASGGSGSYSYSWSPALLLDDYTSTDPTTIALNYSTIFTLSVTDNVTGCINTSQVQVIIAGGALAATASASPQIICEGNSTQLNALPQGGTGNYQYTWTSNPPSIFADLIKNPIVSPTITTQYTVVINDGSGMASAAVVVTINPLPNAASAITGDNELCQGSTGVLYSESIITNATGYIWTLPNGAILTAGSNTQNIAVHYTQSAVSGNITVSGTNFCGTGPASPPLHIQVDSLPQVEAGTHLNINQHDSVHLHGIASGGSGNFTYNWTPTAFLIPPTNIPNPVSTDLSSSVVYTLAVTDNVTGCLNSDQIQIIVSGIVLSVSASANPTTICENGQSTLFALPTGGSGNPTYLWSSVPSGLNSSSQNPVVTPTITTTYTVIVTDGAQTASASTTVLINTLPDTAGTITGVTSVCKGESGVHFSIPLINGATSYVWSYPSGATIGSGANTNSINLDFSLISPSGNITVYGVNACGNGISSSHPITLNSLPTANAGSSVYILPGVVSLHGTATGGSGTYNYTWAPAFLLNNANIQDPLTTITISTPTSFYLTVTDASTGCKGTDDMTVYIQGGTLSVAATASPTNMCQGQSSTLNALPTGGVGNYTYAWTSNPSGGFGSTIQNPVVSPTVSTTYYVTAISGTNTASASVTVTVNPLPATPGSITGTNIICQGTNNIIYTVPPVSGATSYNWLLPQGVSIVGGQGTNSIIVNFSTSADTGNKVITVSGANLCGSGPSSTGFHVTVNASPHVNAGVDYFLPTGNDTTLIGTVYGGTGPFSYLWSPLMFFYPSSEAHQLNATTINISSSVTFTLTVMDSSTGCTASDQMNVYSLNPNSFTVTASASPTNICQGQTTQLSALPSGGTGNYQYSWSSFPVGYYSTLQNPIFSPSVTEQFLVNVTSGTQSASNTVVVHVNPLPGASDTIIGTSPVCQGATNVMFSVPTISNATSYIWTVPSGFTIVSGNFTNTIYVDIANNASTGSVTVYGINSCGVGVVSPYFNVNVNVTPFAYTSADHLVPLNTIDTLNGYAIGGSGSYTYTWTPASLFIDNTIQNPVTVPLTHSAIFTLLVTDNVYGCQSSNQVQIIVYGGPLSIDVSSDSYNICAGESAHLNVLPTGGNGAYTYTWTPAGSLNNASIYNPVATPGITTDYNVTATSGTGTASQTVSSTVLINVSPSASNAGSITGVSSVCQGDNNITFTVPPINNATTYHWTTPYGSNIISGGTTNSIIVNFTTDAIPGNITVYGSNVCGFGATSPNFWLNVHTTPIVYAGADQQIQAGTNTNLHGLVGGNGDFTYQWTPSNLFVNNNDTILNPVTQNLFTSHIFTLYVTDTVSGCTSSDYMKVIVCDNTGNTPLSVIAYVNNVFADTICEGQTVQLDALATGGNCVSGDYSWTSLPSGFVSPLTNPIATPTISTTYIVSYSDGTNTTTNSVTVTVNPLVHDAGQIQGPSIVCQNSGTVTYSIPPIIGATSYVWSFPQGTIFFSNPDSNVVVVIFTDNATSGFISVYATSSCGIGLPSPTFPVTVKPIPASAGQILGPSYIAKGNTTQFSVPLIAGTSTYYWVLPYGAVILSGQGTNTITVEFTDNSKSGFIYVYGINSCGTGNPSSTHLLTIVTSISEFYDIDYKLYPNPNNGEFTLEINAATDDKYEMKIFNLFGSEVFTSQITEKQNHLNFSQLPNGMYNIVLTNNKVKIVERFIIMK